MKILILVTFFARLIIAETIYRQHVNPNDEPFLPINPKTRNIHSYTPEVAKRSSDKEVSTFGGGAWGPRTDPGDSLTAGFAGSPPEDPFHSGHAGFFGAFPRSPASPSYSAYSPYFGNNLFGLYSNPYAGNPYASGVHGYFDQPPYFHPDYYDRGFNPHLHPLAESRRPRSKEPSSNGNRGRMSMEKKSEKTKPAKTPESFASQSPAGVGRERDSNESGNEYVDGNNSILQNPKEMMSSSQRFLAAGGYGRRQSTDFQRQMSRLPPATYRVISVGGQPVGPNYPLPESYARAKLMEEAAAVQSLVESLGTAMNGAAAGRESRLASLPNEESGKMNGKRYFSGLSSVPGRSGSARTYGNDEINSPPPDERFFGGDRVPQDNRRQRGGKYSPGPEIGVDEGERNGERLFVQSPAARAKNAALQSYQNLSYVPDSPTAITDPDRSQSAHIPEENVKPVMEDAAEDPPSRSATSGSLSYRSERNYDNSGRPQHPGNSYRSRNPAPQTFDYRVMNLRPFSRGGDHRQVATDLEDVNFGTKQRNKE